MTGKNSVNPATNDPIFVIGSSRSGTTLMYSILLSSGQFPIYEAETHLLDGCPIKYGNIKNDKKFDRFFSDWTNSKQFFRSGMEVDELRRLSVGHHNSYTDFLGFFMNTLAEKQGKSRWVEQTPGHVLHMKRLSKAFPKARYIHLIRDGRDVAISKRKLGWTGSNSADEKVQFLYGLLDWENAARTGRAYGRALGGRYLEIHYEDLVSKTGDVLVRINEFANLNITHEQLAKGGSVGSLKRGNTAFGESMVGISENALGRWRKSLTEDEIQIASLYVGNTLREFGYDVDDEHISKNRKARQNAKLRKRIFQIKYRAKKILKEKTPLGRYTATCLEIGLR